MPVKESQNKIKKEDKSVKKMDELVNNLQKDKVRYQRAMQVSKDRYRLCQPTHFDADKITNQTPRISVKKSINPEAE